MKDICLNIFFMFIKLSSVTAQLPGNPSNRSRKTALSWEIIKPQDKLTEGLIHVSVTYSFVQKRYQLRTIYTIPTLEIFPGDRKMFPSTN